MALWKQALAKLRGSADEVPAAGNTGATEEAATGEPAAVEHESDESAGAPVADVLARELEAGIQVSIGDLQTCRAGWCYRGHPVMLFGPDAPELNDPKRRRAFASRVHLHPCSSALEEEQRGAWIASSDLATINASHDGGPFTFCGDCLQAAAGQGASTPGFDFLSHVRNCGDSYFAKKPQYWQAGAESRPLQGPADGSRGSCPKCGCAAEASHWQLNADDARLLSLPEGICLLCAERQVQGCLYISEAELLDAARARYGDLLQKAAKAPAPSWKLAEAMLPLGWQPLLRRLQRMLPPPELFYSCGHSARVAILAWPGRARGVIEHRGETESEGDGDWRFWTRTQIESELGFRLR